ncbi:MAG: tRNA 4-thiouridine(8) synthase ThiI [Clostridiaceae bacterium]|nr:tRNA 4-thiouridine(8) synthase ThiI [Clostridiaceae bacterium]
MQTILLVRYGEIMLKGLNRPIFEKKLVENIRKAVRELGEMNIVRAQGRIFIEPHEGFDEFPRLIEKVRKVFGVVSVSPAYKTGTDMETVYETAVLTAKEAVAKDGAKTFKVEARRQDKNYTLTSPEICQKVGGYVLRNVKELKVDVHNPDFELTVEIRDHAYIFSRVIPAFGGMPTGSSGKAVLLLSGGIDSPVAGWMMAKRGIELHAVHFYSYPYTSERAKDKVIKLTKILSEYTSPVTLHIVPFTDIQLRINERCSIGLITIIMRRAMMRIAERIALQNDALALITGESVGQVASQTMEALNATNAVVKLPVYRPLVGMDKVEVINIAEKIGTYETSILPYEDCCTVFVAKHPVIKPKLPIVEQQEAYAELDELIETAIQNTETITFQ